MNEKGKSERQKTRRIEQEGGIEEEGKRRLLEVRNQTSAMGMRIRAHGVFTQRHRKHMKKCFKRYSDLFNLWLPE